MQPPAAYAFLFAFLGAITNTQDGKKESHFIFTACRKFAPKLLSIRRLNGMLLMI